MSVPESRAAVRGPALDERLVTVVVPAFNEAGTVGLILRKLALLPFRKEVIVVDDGSTDATAAVAEEAARETGARVFRSAVNLGKGAAVRMGFALGRGGILAVQDADVELDPLDLARVVARFDDPSVRAVYGSRFSSGRFKCTRLQRLANGFLSLLTSVLYGARITDMETCCKAFRREVLARVALESLRFEIEPEVTAKVLRLGVRIEEVPISYEARTRAQGKKIGWRDGLAACFALLRWRVARRRAFEVTR